MTEKAKLVKMGVDLYKNRFASDKFSKADANEVLRQALIDLNGGSTKVDFKALRRNKNEMFEIIEEILENTVLAGLPDDSFFHQFVDWRNTALGDQNSFYIPDNTLLTVSEIAAGTQALRRQRLDVGTNVTIKTSWKGVKIYEHLTRLLSGRVDLDEMIDGIEKAFKVAINNDIYDAFIGSFTSLPSGFTTSGAFDEDSLMDIVDHVEASTGKSAIIAGTKKALRKVATAIVSDSAKEDMYKMGHYGYFNGTPMVSIKQVHNAGTYTFKLSENDLYVVTSDEKPVKFVTEGEIQIMDGATLGNADLTQEYFSATLYGTGVAITDLYGKYELSS